MRERDASEATSTDALMNSAEAAMHAAKRKQSRPAFAPSPVATTHNVNA